jgi:hypothetical protein
MTPAEAAGFLCRDEDEVRKKAKQMKIPYGQARSYCHYRLRRRHGNWRSGGGVLLGQAVRHLDENRHCDSRICAWLAVLFDRQQHADLFAYSTRRPAVKGRPLTRAREQQSVAPATLGLDLPPLLVARADEVIE